MVLAFAVVWLGNPWSEARAGICGKCSGAGRYWDGWKGWVKCDRCNGTGVDPEVRDNRTPDDPSWPTRISAWAVEYQNGSESVNDLYAKIGPNLWQRILAVTPNGGVQVVQARYTLTETGQRGSDFLDLDDTSNNQVIRLRHVQMDIFRRAQQRWDVGVYTSGPQRITWR